MHAIHDTRVYFVLTLYKYHAVSSCGFLLRAFFFGWFLPAMYHGHRRRNARPKQRCLVEIQIDRRGYGCTDTALSLLSRPPPRNVKTTKRRKASMTRKRRQHPRQKVNIRQATHRRLTRRPSLPPRPIKFKVKVAAQVPFRMSSAKRSPAIQVAVRQRGGHMRGW